MHPHQALPRLALAFAFSLGLCSPLTSPAERGSDCHFDYIIVGGGNAGLTLASRLSESSTVRVAIIEAGTFYERVTGNESIIPGNGGLYEGKAANITNPLVEWEFMTTPQAGLNNQSVHYPRGKTLGGCTALNAMNYERPNCRVNGFIGRSERKAYGLVLVVHTIDQASGKRASSETAFLRPFLGRENLVVFDQTMAERILFKRNVARGVTVSDMSNNRTFDLFARREVIISAGAFQSTQLLMVSGVGPAGLLSEHGIHLVANRPGVGQNMHDHVLFEVAYEVNVETAYALRDPNAAAEAATIYHEDQAGPLSNSGGNYAAFERLPLDFRGGLSAETEQAIASLPSDWPEVQYGLFPAYAGNFYNPYIGGPTEGNYATLLAILMSPQSRGNISIPSPNMRDSPLINPALLTHPADLELAVAAFKRLRSIFRAPALEGVLIGDEYYPRSNVTTDEQIIGHLRDAAYTMSPAAGTCKMGVEEDETAVVDSVGRMFGTRNLRVADASAFPFLPPNVPQSIVYMPAEKIADDIKGTW